MEDKLKNKSRTMENQESQELDSAQTSNGGLETAHHKVFQKSRRRKKTSQEEKAQRDKITALTQDLKKEQQEKEDLRVLVAALQSSLNENEELKNALDSERQATGKAQGTLRKVEKQNQLLTTEDSSLKSALEKEQKNTRQSQAKLVRLEREYQQLTEELSSLKSALENAENNTRDDQAKLVWLEGERRQLTEEVTSLKSDLRKEQKYTRQAQDKVVWLEREYQQLTGEMTSLKSALRKEKKALAKLEELKREHQEVTNLKSALREERAKLQTLQYEKVKPGPSHSEENREHMATTRALNQSLQNEGVPLCTVIEKLNAVWESTLAEKDQLMSTEVQNCNVLQEKVKELSVALTSLDETNAALKRQNQDLQDHIIAKEDRRKRSGWFCRT